MKLTLITSNAGKAKQVAQLLNTPVDHKSIDLTEIQTLDLDELITHKVKEAYKEIKKPVIVDDTALVIHAMGRLPGPYVKWFLHEIGTEGICKIAHTFKDTSASAIVSIGLYDGKTLKIFQGEVKGKVAKSPKGEGGFGWDSTFIPDGYTQTRAQMNEENYLMTAPRGIALTKLQQYLNSIS